jgi:hypothetical protein
VGAILNCASLACEPDDTRPITNQAQWRRSASSASLPVTRSSASRSAGDAKFGLIHQVSFSRRTLTRLSPTTKSRTVPSTGQRCRECGSDRLKMVSKIALSAAACATAFPTILVAIRVSPLPVAVRCATMKAINTRVHNTMIRAKPPSWRPNTGVEDLGNIDLSVIFDWVIVKLSWADTVSVCKATALLSRSLAPT